jgi:predicted AlkP superfamily pyrophosphatase or phosphodiesterase
MLNKNSFNKEITFNKEFIKPQYENYCFANIPSFILDQFNQTHFSKLPKDVIFETNKNYQKIIFFLIDGFGWRFFEKYQTHPFFKFIEKNGVISKLTSQFPSTTAVHVTCIHTGLPVGESGVFEWFYYEPKVDLIIAPLLYSTAGNKEEREKLKKFPIKPKNIYPKKTFYQILKNNGIKSYIFQHKEYTPSSYSNWIFRGATKIFPYKTMTEALVNLFSVLENEKEKSYYFLYFDKIDSISHQYGPSSKQTEEEILTFLDIMTRLFLKEFQKQKEVLFLLTADHGQMEVSPKTTFYLNKKTPKIKKWLKTNKNSQLLVPAGSPRDMFLYVKEEFLNEAFSYLSKKLNNIALVYKTVDLIREGFFGEKISNNFLKRVGNLVILPYKNQTVWWYEKGVFEQRFYGHHGGLSGEEMEIGLVSLNV